VEDLKLICFDLLSQNRHDTPGESGYMLIVDGELVLLPLNLC
jgi:hypothetical protein